MMLWLHSVATWLSTHSIVLMMALAGRMNCSSTHWLAIVAGVLTGWTDDLQLETALVVCGGQRASECVTSEAKVQNLPGDISVEIGQISVGMSVRS
eukprot:jgi/Botrbrau1/4791/Bobra.0325s0013.1